MSKQETRVKKAHIALDETPRDSAVLRRDVDGQE
jgi:hypothetical protein